MLSTGPLVVASSSYPRHGDDSAGRFVAASVDALNAAGVQTEVVAPADPDCQVQKGVTHFRYAPLKNWQRLCYGFGIVPNLKRNPALALLLPGLAAGLGRHLWRRRQLPQLAHFLLPTAATAAAVGVRRFAAIAHGSDVALLERLPGGALLAQFIAQRARALAFASQQLQERFCALLNSAEPIGEVIPPAFYAPQPEPRPVARKTLGIPPDAVVVLFLGRLVPTKGVSVLLQSLEHCPLNTLCLVAGDGPQRGLLEKQAEKLQQRVRFLGHQPPSLHAMLFGAADILAVPSYPDHRGHAEGLPTVLLEGCAAKIPVVASEVGGIPELLKHNRSGLLVPPRDPQLLGQALGNLAQSPALRKRLVHQAQLAIQPLLPQQHAARLLRLVLE